MGGFQVEKGGNYGNNGAHEKKQTKKPGSARLLAGTLLTS
jgi:hypothetical protein